MNQDIISILLDADSAEDFQNILLEREYTAPAASYMSALLYHATFFYAVNNTKNTQIYIKGTFLDKIRNFYTQIYSLNQQQYQSSITQYQDTIEAYLERDSPTTAKRPYKNRSKTNTYKLYERLRQRYVSRLALWDKAYQQVIHTLETHYFQSCYGLYNIDIKETPIFYYTTDTASFIKNTSQNPQKLFSEHLQIDQNIQPLNKQELKLVKYCFEHVFPFIHFKEITPQDTVPSTAPLIYLFHFKNKDSCYADRLQPWELGHNTHAIFFKNQADYMNNQQFFVHTLLRETLYILGFAHIQNSHPYFDNLAKFQGYTLQSIAPYMLGACKQIYAVKDPYPNPLGVVLKLKHNHAIFPPQKRITTEASRKTCVSFEGNLYGFSFDNPYDSTELDLAKFGTNVTVVCNNVVGISFENKQEDAPLPFSHMVSFSLETNITHFTLTPYDDTFTSAPTETKALYIAPGYGNDTIHMFSGKKHRIKIESEKNAYDQIYFHENSGGTIILRDSNAYDRYQEDLDLVLANKTNHTIRIFNYFANKQTSILISQ